MQRQRWTILAAGLVCVSIVCSAFAQQPAGGAPAGGPPAAGGRGAGRGAGPAAAAPAGAQAAAPAARGGNTARVPLFFKEEWKQNATNSEHPADQDAVANPNLELKLYGQGHDVQIAGAATNEGNPIHLWTGNCTTACAATLRHKTNFADLTGLARIKWFSKMSGYHAVRPLIKLANGDWLVGDHADDNNVDWLTHEFSLSGMRWLKLDITRVVTTGTWVPNPDLTKVDEIGFVDLTPGSGHGAGGWADVGVIEVYGKSVPR